MSLAVDGILENQEYDIVICGGGTAGCVLAARLSENPNCSVLLLEAGGNHNDDPRVRTPGLFAQSLGDKNLDWDYWTEPQPHLNGKRMAQPRGKGLGGSSLLNILNLIYPSKADFDAWAEMGNVGWDWNSMLPYLRKFQTLHFPKDEQVVKDLGLSNIDISAHGSDGPIQASYPQEVHPLQKAWIDTFKTMGYQMKADTLSGESLGGYTVVSTIDPSTQQRVHAGVAYVTAAQGRENLTVITDAIVQRVMLVEGSVATAKGVVVQVHGKVYEVHARKEVILCAGSYGSPCLLERSGIGNSDLLKRIGIDCEVENRNVGENLSDHIMCGVSFELEDGMETIDNFRDPTYVEAALKQYQANFTGPLSLRNPSFAFMPLIDQKNPSGIFDVSDLLKQHLSTASIEHSTTRENASRETVVAKMLSSPNEASANICTTLGQAHLSQDTVMDKFAPTDPGNFISIWSALCHPLSCGSVHIRDKNPLSDPIIDPNYYSHPLDMEIMSRHVQFFDRVVNTEPMKSLIKPNGARIPSGARFDSLQYTKELIHNSSMSNYHPIGTCAMKPVGEGGVIDERLRVYGVKGLRVCDASIIPILPRGNIMSAVYAIAEKAADILKEDLL